MGPSLAFEVTHEAGKVTEQWVVEDAELVALGAGYLRALADAGGGVPANVACVHTGSEWLGLELNGRFTGGTAARTAMGFDEVGLAINAWAGRGCCGAAATLVRRAVMQPSALDWSIPRSRPSAGRGGGRDRGPELTEIDSSATEPGAGSRRT